MLVSSTLCMVHNCYNYVCQRNPSLLNCTEFHLPQSSNESQQCDTILGCSRGDHCDAIKPSGPNEYPLRIVPSSMRISLADCSYELIGGRKNELKIFLPNWLEQVQMRHVALHNRLLLDIGWCFWCWSSEFRDKFLKLFAGLCKLYHSITSKTT